MWKDSHIKGLKHVHQLYRDMKPISTEEAKTLGLTTLRLNSLISALPKEWKEYFSTTPKSQYLPLPPHNLDYALQGNQRGFAQQVYRYLADDVLLIHQKYISWRMELGYQFRDLHMDIYKTTNVTKYRSFQYRLIQRAIVTNIHLEKWKIIEKNLCSFCQQQPEQITHLFWYCPKVQEIWIEIIGYIQERFSTPVLTPGITQIIFNQLVDQKCHAANFIILLTKHYIYKSRCLGNQLKIKELKQFIKSIEATEKYIATKNNKLMLHNRKWEITT